MIYQIEWTVYGIAKIDASSRNEAIEIARDLSTAGLVNLSSDDYWRGIDKANVTELVNQTG